MYSYHGLELLLKAKNINKTDLTTKLGISSRTIAKISKGEKLSNNTLKKIALFLSCNIEDLYQELSNNIILNILKEEKEYKISGGLYHELQILMTYNSNHIEGSKLSKDQTRLIFKTRTIDTVDGLPIDDIIETSNHFRCIDYCIDMANNALNEDFIKHLHFLLKQGTKDSFLSWFNVGDYKGKANMVGGNETCKPTEVSSSMKQLLLDYNSKSKITFEDIVKFHHDFETIHPFQDGNGRVGRLIAFKECLRFNIIPFIIEDSKKGFYYRGLKNWNNDPAWLIDTCLDGQDTFKKILEKFNISINK